MPLEPDVPENSELFEDPEYLTDAWGRCTHCDKPIKGEHALRWKTDVYCSLDCIERQQDLYRHDRKWYEEFPFHSYLGAPPPGKTCDYCDGPLPRPGDERCLRVEDKVPPGQPHSVSLCFCNQHCCGSYQYEEHLKEKGDSAN